MTWLDEKSSPLTLLRSTRRQWTGLSLTKTSRPWVESRQTQVQTWELENPCSNLGFLLLRTYNLPYSEVVDNFVHLRHPTTRTFSLPTLPRSWTWGHGRSVSVLPLNLYYRRGLLPLTFPSPSGDGTRLRHDAPASVQRGRRNSLRMVRDRVKGVETLPLHPRGVSAPVILLSVWLCTVLEYYYEPRMIHVIFPNDNETIFRSESQPHSFKKRFFSKL